MRYVQRPTLKDMLTVIQLLTVAVLFIPAVTISVLTFNWIQGLEAWADLVERWRL